MSVVMYVVCGVVSVCMSVCELLYCCSAVALLSLCSLCRASSTRGSLALTCSYLLLLALSAYQLNLAPFSPSIARLVQWLRRLLELGSWPRVEGSIPLGVKNLTLLFFAHFHIFYLFFTYSMLIVEKGVWKSQAVASLRLFYFMGWPAFST